MLKIPRGYKGKEGFFEFIKDSAGQINHRLTAPNPGNAAFRLCQVFGSKSKRLAHRVLKFE
jgi:hypothetical protein